MIQQFAIGYAACALLLVGIGCTLALRGRANFFLRVNGSSAPRWQTAIAVVLAVALWPIALALTIRNLVPRDDD